MGLCVCPAGDIVDIPKEVCKTGWREIQKVVIQKIGYAGAANEAEFITKTYWDGLTVAADATKVQSTPFVYDFVKTAGTPITEDGLNNTLEIYAAEASTIEGQLRGTSGDLMVALKTYWCLGSVELYFINGDNQIIANSNGTAPKGFRADGFFIGDRSNVKNESDKNLISFNMAFGVEDTFKIYNPEAGFLPLQDI